MFDEEDLFGVFDEQQSGQPSALIPERKAPEEARSTASISRKRATPVDDKELGNGDEDLGPPDDNDEGEEEEETQERRKEKRPRLNDPDLEYALI